MSTLPPIGSGEPRIPAPPEPADSEGLRETVRIAIVGHVDHGKSTLVGRLLHDTGSLPAGKVEAIAESCRRRGMPFEWAFAMDALRAERDQGVTIDVSHVWFRTGTRDYVLLDTPGHQEFLRNMVTGAAACDAALLVIDALEGVRDQSRRHAYLLSMLGLAQVVVAVNKMDLVGYAEETFAALAERISQYLATLGLAAAAIVPVAARSGENVGTRSEAMGWYRGPTLLEVFAGFTPNRPSSALPLRVPVQDVYKVGAQRVVVGRVESGKLAVGDQLLFLPSQRTARVASIEAWGAREKVESADAGEVLGFTLDEPIFVARGDVASHGDSAPALTDVFEARVFWLVNEPLRTGRSYRMRLNTAEIPVRVERIKEVLDLGDGSSKGRETVPKHCVAEIVVHCAKQVAVDDHRRNVRTGRFVLLDDDVICGGGLVDMSAYPDQRRPVAAAATNTSKVAHRVSPEMRARRHGHAGGLLWLTGLSGAGKSTLAVAAEQRLFELGYQVYLLDGDNLRRGLNANLGFGPDDRAENIRRAGEVAVLFSEAGMIAIVALISPYRAERERARAAARETAFHEVYVKADLATCEARDPKGLYKLARAGKIAQFTGISAPYEPPERPELVVDTERLTVEQSVDAIVSYVREHFPFGARKAAGPLGRDRDGERS
jgi:bifunctional enzyme CysN/CysC